MTNIKKKIFYFSKLAFSIVGLLILILFFYAAFFYKPLNNNLKTSEQDTLQPEKTLGEENEKIQESETTEVENKNIKEESKTQKVIEENKETTTTANIESSIRDGLFLVIGNKAITKSDIVDEIKIILILNNMSYSVDKRDALQDMAVKAVIKRTVKEIEISNYDFIEYNKNDLYSELNRLALRINMDLDTLKNVCASNELDFSIIEKQVITELLWNSLVFYLYKNRISVNVNEIEDQLKLSHDKKEFQEFLISEIVAKPVQKEKLELKIKEIKNRIENEGFKSIAMELSISQSASKGGDLGWVNENEISSKLRKIIQNTPEGSVSEAIILKEGILFFKVRKKRKVQKEIDLEELKNQLVNSEKTKVLNMYAISHYDTIRRSVSVKFFNE